MTAGAGSEPLFRRAALIGIGLIGSSLARAMVKHGLVGEIAIATRSQATLDKARSLHLGVSYSLDPAEAVVGADLVVIGTPLGAYAEIAERIGPLLEPGVIVSDVGSVKQAVIRDVAPHLPDGVHFVPGHPIAGTEHSGPEAGFAELFEDRWCVLTPPPGCNAQAVEKVTSLWRSVGSSVQTMDAGHHDKVLAITSHLPHIIAYTIVGTAADLEASDRAEVIKFSASGFRDFTRIAASDPIMWRDIFLNNREPVLEMLQRFSEDLTAIQRAIRWGEGEELEARFRRTRAIRRGVVEAHQAGSFDPREPDELDGERPGDADLKEET
jgi:cyclohexadieny/prephenate dehydrogenase